MDKSVMDELAAIIKRAEDGAYARGRADANKDLLAHLSAQATPAKRAAPQPEKTLTKGEEKAIPRIRPLEGVRLRAPRGVVPAFVSRVLSKQPNVTPKEILAHVETEFERMIKPPSLRSELRNGRKQGRYRSEFGRWSLANTKNEEPEGGPATETPSDSNDDNGGSHGTALAEPPDRL